MTVSTKWKINKRGRKDRRNINHTLFTEERVTLHNTMLDDYPNSSHD